MGRFVAYVTSMTVCMVMAVCFLPQVTYAAANKDLSIAPLRTEKTIDAGKSTSGTFKVTNDTEAPMTIKLSVKQFSVQDYTYNYLFREPDVGWVSLTDSQIQLQPGSSKQIGYTVTVPIGAAPGGHYFSMIAGTTVSGGRSFPITMQVGTLLYLTVNGTTTKRAELGESQIPSVVFGRTVPYQFDVRSTGNTHFTADFFVQMGDRQSGQEGMVLPDTTRRIKGSVDAPVLPGLYTVTYGYETDSSSEPVTRTTRVLYVPVWFILATVVVVFVAVITPIRHRRKRSKANSSR